MVKVIALLAAASVVTAPATLPQQTPPAPATTTAAVKDADPALWVVKDADTTIYLFGTIHVLKPGLSWFDEAVKNAFDSSQSLVLEMVMPEKPAMRALVMKYGLNPDGTPLSQQLPADIQPAFAEAAAGLGAPPAMLDTLKPWLVATELSVAPLVKLGYDPDAGPEAVLTAAAKTTNKQVLGIETPDQQFGYLDSLSHNAQIAFLSSAIKDLPTLGQDMDTMVSDWSRGDPDALAVILNEDMEGQPELKKKLLTDRNMHFASWIDERLKQPGTVFMAVGAGHLAGKGSVQDDLANTFHLQAERIIY